jgi:ABC-type Na+ efflux pump permease subunit
MNKTSKSMVFMQLAIVIMALWLIFVWLLIGFISGIKPPFAFMGIVFEGGYSPEPNFMAALNNIVITLIAAVLGAAGLTSAAVLNRKVNESVTTNELSVTVDEKDKVQTK